MSAIESTEAGLDAPPQIARKWIILGGRIVLAAALLLAWETCARSFGLLFFAPPWDVLKRIAEISMNGELVEDVLVTLRVSALGFVIGCAGGILLPFLLHRSLRLTQAVEPYIIASMGIPKYALAPWLILWFGIGDLPKLVISSLMVFYIIFVTTFSGIRAVDQRLVNMARIVGASETVIAREVVWRSLLPFFFTGLKVALPRAVGATIVGEFLVSSAGIGYYIEHARELSDTVGVFAGIILATALVLVINAVVTVIERRALAWRPVAQDMRV